MGCPATTKPPQHYSHRRVYSLAVLPAAFALARHPQYCTLNTAPYTVRGGVLRGPSPGLVHLFLPPPLFEFKEVLCLLHSLHQPPVNPHHRVSALFLILPEQP